MDAPMEGPPLATFVPGGGWIVRSERDEIGALLSERPPDAGPSSDGPSRTAVFGQ